MNRHKKLFRDACFLLACTGYICLGGYAIASPESTAAKQQAKLKHIGLDESDKDSSFASFKNSLAKAVENHDKSFMENCVSPEILTTLGGEKGKQAFLKEWQSLSADSPFWSKMHRLLSHGVQLDEGTQEFHAPAVIFEDSHSELPQAVIWSKEAVMYKTPDGAGSPVPHTLYDEQVTLVDPDEPAPNQKAWSKIILKDGSSGYVKSQDLYSAYDEFAVFKKSGDHWQISWFGYASL